MAMEVLINYLKRLVEQPSQSEIKMVLTLLFNLFHGRLLAVETR